MPDSEPLPDAPASVWVSGLDAQLYFNEIGMGILAPFAANFFNRVVVMEELCALPPPATQEITLSDINDFVRGGDAGEAAERRMHSWVDRGLWEGNCRFVDDSEPDPIVPQTDIPDLPVGPLPKTRAQEEMEQLLLWVGWLAREMLPRAYHGGNTFDVSGQGHLDFDFEFGSPWMTPAAGAEITVTAKPDYLGRSNGGDFPVFYDMGWFSLDSGTMGQQPVRLQHTKQMVYGSLAKVNGMYYNLNPGVEIHVRVLYPDRPEGLGEG